MTLNKNFGPVDSSTIKIACYVYPSCSLNRVFQPILTMIVVQQVLPQSHQIVAKK